MRLSREALLGAFLVVALGGGVALDLVTESLAAGPAPGAAPIFDERSVYCPPPPVLGETASSVVLGTAAPGEVLVGIDQEERVELAPERTLVVDTVAPTDLVGYGQEIVASSLTRFTGKVGGTGAARCSKAASTQWHFAEGSSAVGAEQRLLVYNPFPDEAVVSVSLLTPKGPESNARLAEGLAVPAGEATVIELNEYIRQHNFVGASIIANRGRVIVWRALQLSQTGRPDSAQFTLGATAPATEWFFPGGALDEGIEERISLLNPTDEEAVATVSLATGSETIQPPQLLEVVIPPQTLLPLPLKDNVGGADRRVGGASVIVRTTSGRVVAERSVHYETGALTGSASEVGATRATSRWLAAPAVAEPRVDSIVLLNPGAEAVSVSLSLLSPGEKPLLPDALQDLFVTGATRLQLPLTKWTRGEAYSVLVDADGPVVAERFAAEGPDVAAVMGLPLKRNER
ncbi:MAG: DUF5719 family protein [Actinomycetota bacterium]|nr:DUF5719 family protein [Actinomycetota bacterium]